MAKKAAPATTRRFPKKLYRFQALKDAVAAYEPFATLDVAKDADAWTVTFTGVQDDLEPEVLAGEFANYVLAGTVQAAR